MDNWNNRQKGRQCGKCMHFYEKLPIDTGRTYTIVGRCRRHAPSTNEGWPVVFPTDSCGDFKLDENKI